MDSRETEEVSRKPNNWVEYDEQNKKQLHQCGNCGEVGHNRRTCPEPDEMLRAPENMAKAIRKKTHPRYPGGGEELKTPESFRGMARKQIEKPLKEIEKNIQVATLHIAKGEEREIIRGLIRDDDFHDFIQENYEIQEETLPGCLGVNDPTMKRMKLIRKRDDRLLNVWEVKMEEA